jgi:hypothetical protein
MKYKYWRRIRFFLCDIMGIHQFTIDEQGQPRCIHCDRKLYTIRNKHGKPVGVTALYLLFRLLNSKTLEAAERKQRQEERPALLERQRIHNETAGRYYQVCHWLARQLVTDADQANAIAHIFCNDTPVHTIQCQLIGLEHKGVEGAKERYPITQEYEALEAQGFPT